MSQHGEGAEPMHVVESRAHQRAIDFRLTELDGKIQRRIQDSVEVVRSIGEFPEIFCLHCELSAELLLDASVELIASRGRERLDGGCSQGTVRETPGAG